MGIKDWPEGERPREKLLARGAAALSDTTLLAIFPRTVIRGLQAFDLARALIRDFGGLVYLQGAKLSTLCATRGPGEPKYAQLKAVVELSRRHLGEPLV